jgi:hypothetical protein
MTGQRKALTWLLFGILTTLLAGCAGTAGSAKALASLAKDENLARYTRVSFVTSSGGDAAGMTAADRDRIVALVLRKLKERAPTRFADAAATATDPQTLQVTIAFTRYDQGNAIARFMLAGLGQIHIDADVTLQDQSRQAALAKYEVTKTFAWGGIYGGVTNIKEVEDGFADAVAKVVLGQTD